MPEVDRLFVYRVAREQSVGMNAEREGVAFTAITECAKAIGKVPSLGEYDRWRIAESEADSPRIWPCGSNIRGKFGSWAAALEAIGFRPTPDILAQRLLANGTAYSRSDCIAAVREWAEVELDRLTGHGSRSVFQFIDSLGRKNAPILAAHYYNVWVRAGRASQLRPEQSTVTNTTGLGWDEILPKALTNSDNLSLACSLRHSLVPEAIRRELFCQALQCAAASVGPDVSRSSFDRWTAAQRTFVSLDGSSLAICAIHSGRIKKFFGDWLTGLTTAGSVGANDWRVRRCDSLGLRSRNGL